MSLSTEQIARICHEANKAICEANGDESQVHWEEAPLWQRDSAIKGVLFAQANPELTAEDQHIAWCNDKWNTGWVYGERKDAKAKTHPCLVRYSELPEEQKLKDIMFRAIVVAASK